MAGGRSIEGLGRRLVLTYRYLGLRTLAWRVVSFPLRFTPLRLPLGLGTHEEQHRYRAARWHARQGPPVTVVGPGEPLRAPAGHDVAVADRQIDLPRDWVAAMQYAAHVEPGTAIVSGLVTRADGRVESAGLCSVGPRYRDRPDDYLAAHVEGPVLAPAPELAFVRGDALRDTLAAAADEAWQSGREVLYLPSVTGRRRGGSPRAAEKPASAPRAVRTADGRLRVIYVTQETSVGGGHRDIFEHLNRLAARGHDVGLYSLAGQPDWFPLDVEVQTFPGWEELTRALAGQDAIKVATWWRSALPVWRATRHRGIPVYFVQDVETSYYPDDPRSQARVLDTYRSEFRYMTISGYNRDGLAELGVTAEIVAPGIDLDTFRPTGRERSDAMLLAIGRGNHLKNLDLTVDAWKALGAGRPELCLFGIEPELGSRHGARYVTAPSDAEVNELFNQATIFLQTSRHEGFALPPLEAMATGAAVICTDAHGNRDFCVDGQNCLMPGPTVESVRGAIERLLGDGALRRRLGEAGMRTAQRYDWGSRIDDLEAFLEAAAAAAGPPR